MESKYSQWIIANINDPDGCCAEATVAMVAAFPELTRIRGHYRHPYVPRTIPHWWCSADDGTVIDPTAHQFLDAWMGDYTPHVGPEPTGKCPNCSGYVHSGGGVVCSDTCAREYAAYCLAS